MTAYAQSNPDHWVQDLNDAVNAASAPVQPVNTTASLVVENYDFNNTQPVVNYSQNYNSYEPQDFDILPIQSYQPNDPSALTTTHAATINPAAAVNTVGNSVTYSVADSVANQNVTDPVVTYDSKGNFIASSSQEAVYDSKGNVTSTSPQQASVSNSLAASNTLNSVVDSIADQFAMNETDRNALGRIMAADPQLSPVAVTDFIAAHSNDYDFYLNRYDGALAISQSMNLSAEDKGLVETAMTQESSLDFNGMLDFIERHPSDWREKLEELVNPNENAVTQNSSTNSPSFQNAGNSTVQPTGGATTSNVTAASGSLNLTPVRSEWHYEVSFDDFLTSVQNDQSKWVQTRVQVNAGPNYDYKGNVVVAEPVYEMQLLPPSIDAISALYVQNYGSPLDKSLGRLSTQYDVTTSAGDYKSGTATTSTTRVTVNTTRVTVDPNNRNRDIVWTGNFSERIQAFEANSSFNGVSYRDVPADMVQYMDSTTYMARQLSDLAKAAGFSYDNKAGDTAGQLAVYLDTIGVRDATQIFVENGRYIDRSTGQDLGAYKEDEPFAFSAYGDGWNDIMTQTLPDGRVLFVPKWGDSSDMGTIITVVAVVLACTGVGAAIGGAMLSGVGVTAATLGVSAGTFSAIAAGVGGAVVSTGLQAISGQEVTLGSVAKSFVGGAVGGYVGGAFGEYVGATGSAIADGAIRGAAGGFARNLVTGESAFDGLYQGAIGGAAGGAASSVVSFVNTNLNLDLSAQTQGALSGAFGAIITGGSRDQILLGAAQGYGAANNATPTTNQNNGGTRVLTSDSAVLTGADGSQSGVNSLTIVGFDGNPLTFSTDILGNTVLTGSSDVTIPQGMSGSNTLTTVASGSTDAGTSNQVDGLNLSSSFGTNVENLPNAFVDPFTGLPVSSAIAATGSLSTGSSSGPLTFNLVNGSTNNVEGFEDRSAYQHDQVVIGQVSDKGVADGLLDLYSARPSVTANAVTDISAQTAGGANVRTADELASLVSSVTSSVDENYALSIISRLSPLQQAYLAPGSEARQNFVDSVIQAGSDANATLDSIRTAAINSIQELQTMSDNSLADLRSTLGVVLGNQTLNQYTQTQMNSLVQSTTTNINSMDDLSTGQRGDLQRVITTAMTYSDGDRQNLLQDAQLVSTSLQSTIAGLQDQIVNLQSAIATGADGSDLQSQLSNLTAQLGSAQSQLNFTSALVTTLDDVNSQMGAIGVKAYAATTMIGLNQSGTIDRANAMVGVVSSANQQMGTTIADLRSEISLATGNLISTVDTTIKQDASTSDQILLNRARTAQETAAQNANALATANAAAANNATMASNFSNTFLNLGQTALHLVSAFVPGSVANQQFVSGTNSVMRATGDFFSEATANANTAIAYLFRDPSNALSDIGVSMERSVGAVTYRVMGGDLGKTASTVGHILEAVTYGPVVDLARNLNQNPENFDPSAAIGQATMGALNIFGVTAAARGLSGWAGASAEGIAARTATAETTLVAASGESTAGTRAFAVELNDYLRANPSSRYLGDGQIQVQTMNGTPATIVVDDLRGVPAARSTVFAENAVAESGGVRATTATEIPADFDWNAFIAGDLKPRVEGIKYEPNMRADRIELAPQIPEFAGEDCGARAIRLNNLLTGQTVEPRPGGYVQNDFANSFGSNAITEHASQSELLSFLRNSDEGSTFLIGMRPKDPNGIGHVVNAQIVDGRVIIRDAGLPGKYNSSDMAMFTRGNPEAYDFYTVNSTTANPDPFFAGLRMDGSLFGGRAATTETMIPTRNSATTNIIPEDWDPFASDVVTPPTTATTPRTNSVGTLNYLPEDWDVIPAQNNLTSARTPAVANDSLVTPLNQLDSNLANQINTTLDAAEVQPGLVRVYRGSSSTDASRTMIPQGAGSRQETALEALASVYPENHPLVVQARNIVEGERGRVFVTTDPEVARLYAENSGGSVFVADVPRSSLVGSSQLPSEGLARFSSEFAITGELPMTRIDLFPASNTARTADVAVGTSGSTTPNVVSSAVMTENVIDLNAFRSAAGGVSPGGSNLFAGPVSASAAASLGLNLIAPDSPIPIANDNVINLLPRLDRVQFSEIGAEFTLPHPQWVGSVLGALHSTPNDTMVIEAHGGGTTLKVYAPGQVYGVDQPINLNAEQTARLITSRAGYNPNMTIVLNACNTGEAGNLAEQLSRILPNKIVAPNGTTEYNPFTNSNIVESRNSEADSYIAYQNNQVVERKQWRYGS